jgi:hypothetical protein
MGKNARLKRQRKDARSPHPISNNTRTPLLAKEENTSEPPPSSRTARWLSSTSLHVALIVTMCIATGIFPIEAEDIFSNVVTGQLLWTERAIPTTDPFSFTGPHQWFLNRPLPSLIFYGVHSVGGLHAIQLFCTLVFGITYSLAYIVWSRRTAMPLMTFACTTLIILGSCYWFQTRIYVFAYLFVAASLLLITSTHKRTMLLAIPIQILWINSHPSAILGVFLVGCWWLATIWKAQKLDRFSTCIFIGVILANVVCPVGFGSFLKFADEIFGSHPSRANIYEWFSPFHPTITSQHLAWWFYGALLLLVPILMTIFLSTGRIRAAIPLVPVMLILCLLSIGSARHIPLFYLSLLGVVVCVAEHLWKCTDYQICHWLRRHRSLVAVATICASLGVSFKVVAFGYANGDVERRFSFGIDQRKFPESPTQMLLDAKVGGNIFSDYGSGSYFLYRMYPHYKVYIDSARLDEVYGEEGFRRYIQFGNDVQVITRDIAQYDIRSFILPLPASSEDIVQIYKFLSSEPGWRLAFFDDGHMVFITESEATRKGIPTYARLSPFMETEKVLKDNPGAAAELVKDFELGDRINPDSIAFLTLKAYFMKRQGKVTELQATLDRLAGVCARRDPSLGCRKLAARQLIRFGRYSDAKRLAPEEL